MKSDAFHRLFLCAALVATSVALRADGPEHCNQSSNQVDMPAGALSSPFCSQAEAEAQATIDDAANSAAEASVAHFECPECDGDGCDRLVKHDVTEVNVSIIQGGPTEECPDGTFYALVRFHSNKAWIECTPCIVPVPPEPL